MAEHAAGTDVPICLAKYDARRRQTLGPFASLPIRGRDQNLQLVNINDSQDLFLVRLASSCHPGEIHSPPGAETIRSIPADNQIRAVTFLLPVANHRLFSNLPTLQLDLAAPKQQISFQLSHKHFQQTALQVLIKLAMPFAFISCMFGRFRFALAHSHYATTFLSCFSSNVNATLTLSAG